jgi:hypothetical protein
VCAAARILSPAARAFASMRVPARVAAQRLERHDAMRRLQQLT